MASKKTFGILLGLGVAAGAALTLWAMTPKGKSVRQKVQKKVKSGSAKLREMREPLRRHRTYA